MGLFDKSNKVKDNCVIVCGNDTEITAKNFRSKGIRNILTCSSCQSISDLGWPESEVKNFTLCFNHYIPIGVINYDKWYGQVLGSAHLDRWGTEPEMKIISTTSPEKKGSIMLHWQAVNRQRVKEIADILSVSISEWS